MRVARRTATVIDVPDQEHDRHEHDEDAAPLTALWVAGSHQVVKL
jgi:hypothetical protein